MTTIRIATRKSQLALWQAYEVKRLLLENHTDIQVELVPMTTKGDHILDSPLAKIGGKGLFVKELETAMLENQADIAVHSMKDVPAELPQGLEITTLLARANIHDAFVSVNYENIQDLPDNACIGTSSLRRQAQLKACYPQFRYENLRGNVNTRLKKLEENQYDAIILAAAGLERLQLDHHIKSIIPIETSLPAIGQGAIGIECRSDDKALHTLLNPLHDKKTAICVSAERALNAKLNGSCQVPIAAHAHFINDEEIILKALVAEPDGSQILMVEEQALATQATMLGEKLAEQLLSQGADKILQKLLDNH